MLTCRLSGQLSRQNLAMAAPQRRDVRSPGSGHDRATQRVGSCTRAPYAAAGFGCRVEEHRTICGSVLLITCHRPLAMASPCPKFPRTRSLWPTAAGHRRSSRRRHRPNGGAGGHHQSAPTMARRLPDRGPSLSRGAASTAGRATRVCGPRLGGAPPQIPAREGTERQGLPSSWPPGCPGQDQGADLGSAPFIKQAASDSV